MPSTDTPSAGGVSALVAAARDYLWLLDSGYPERPSLSLVGDRHRLDRTSRLVLFRGVCSRAASSRRRSRRWVPAPGAEAPRALAVDGYNVLFTILNYLAGRMLFVGTDGFLRDAGELRGRLGSDARFEELCRELCTYLRDLRVGSVEIWLDRPVSRSGEHAARLRSELGAAAVSGTAELSDSADYAVKHTAAGCIATADGAVIDACALPCFDLARAFLEARYRPSLPDLGALLRGDQSPPAPHAG